MLLISEGREGPYASLEMKFSSNKGLNNQIGSEELILLHGRFFKIFDSYICCPIYFTSK